MSGTGSFLVEEFINSITVQLDRVQDALRLKSLNRPLTYALKDFALDLQVFVELDAQGNVRFRNSAPNETGASTVRLGFTTITKPMIDENTISLAATRSPSLDQIGLEPEERKKLEQLGVHNAAQLRNLYSSTGAQTVSRLAELSVDRLRRALQLSKPQVSQVTPVVASPPPIVTPAPPATAQPPRVSGMVPPVRLPGPIPAPVVRPVIQVPPNTPHLKLAGSGLIGPGGPAMVKLNRVPLNIAQADDDHLLVNLPDAPESGALEVTLPDGDVLQYHLDVQPRDGHSIGAQPDRWEPTGERA